MFFAVTKNELSKNNCSITNKFISSDIFVLKLWQKKLTFENVVNILIFDEQNEQVANKHVV